MGNRPGLTVIIAVLAVYFLVFPVFWGSMPVTVTADIPSEWDHTQDMPVTIVVRAWHPNFALTQARFYIDNQRTKMENVPGPLYPIMLIQEPPIRNWNRLTLNRFTFPISRRYDVVVPFSEMASANNAAPGIIAGKIDVQVDHIGSVHRYSSVGPQQSSEEFNNSIPFEINLK